MVWSDILIGTGIAAAIAYVLFGSEKLSGGHSAGYSPGASISGLRNFGQTCFYNCVLQALAPCTSFCDWLRTSLYLDFSTGGNQYKTRQLLYTVLRDLQWSSDGDDAEALYKLLNEIRDQGWVAESGTQQDAHELFQAIVNLVHTSPDEDLIAGVDCLGSGLDLSLQQVDEKSMQTASVAHKSGLRDKRFPAVSRSSFPILGYTGSHIMCKVCMRQNPTRYTEFTSLSLAFPPKRLSREFRLEDLLRYYFLTDQLSGVDCEGCSLRMKDTIRSDCIKDHNIGKSPQCLCLHIQRMGWYGHHEAIKRHDKIVFPEELNVTEFTQLRKMLKQSLMRLSLTGVVGNCKGDDEAIQSRYKLVSVIVHSGNEDSGHFTTYRRANSNSDTWLYTSDLEVSEVSFSRVENANPYMLFYEKLTKQ